MFLVFLAFFVLLMGFFKILLFLLVLAFVLLVFVFCLFLFLQTWSFVIMKSSLKSIGARISSARQKRSLTQGELAKRVGKSKQLVSAWENGRTEVLASSLVELGLALSVDMNWLLHGTNPSAGVPALPQGTQVPLLDCHHVQRMASGRFKLDERFKRIAILADVSERAFCFRTSDDGMRPWILKGDLLIVDPVATIEPGTPALVLVNSAAENDKAPLILARDIHFKSSELENYQLRLVSRNDAYPSLDVSGKISAKLLGPIVGLHRVASVAAAN